MAAIALVIIGRKPDPDPRLFARTDRADRLDPARTRPDLAKRRRCRRGRREREEMSATEPIGRHGLSCGGKCAHSPAHFEASFSGAVAASVAIWSLELMPRLLVLACSWAFALLAPASGASAQAGPADPGFEVEVYRLSLAPDPASASVRGVETIRLRSLRDGLRTLTFSPNALIIHSANVAGRTARVASGESGISVILPSTLPRGRTATLSLTFHGVPRRGVTATPRSMFTTYFACDWMVCLQDSPGDKARFELDLHLPEGMTSLSIGRQVERTRTAGGVLVDRWRSRRPYPAYLFAFAVGHFTRVEERRDGVLFSYHGEASEAELGRLFADTAAIAAFFTEKAGVPLPDGRYAQLLVPGRAAQEAATWSIIGQDVLEQEANDPSSQWIIAHELAHQWWGNLVTCVSWRHFWLNEGIATFMTAAWKEHRFGPSAYSAELDTARARLARAREAGWDRPLAYQGSYPNLGTRRAIQYSKGALFLDHLRTLLGQSAFWRGLRDFTRTHAGGTVSSRDFQRAMERASRRDLEPVFREWVYG
jgi:aminopeptidase N